MKIVEFIGCPGTGKSTVCQSVMEKLTVQGCAVENFHRNEYREGKLKRMLLNSKAKLSSSTRELRSALKDCLADYPSETGKIWGNDIVKAAFKLENCDAGRLDYVFFDEGPTQYVTSIAHDTTLRDSVQPLLDAMNRSIYSREVIAFYFKAEDDEIIERLKKRNRRGDRFLREDKDEMYSLLARKRSNIETLLSKLNYSRLFQVDNSYLEAEVHQVLDCLTSYRKE